MRKISPFGWLTLRTTLLRGFINVKVKYEGELQISESNLFHSTKVDGEKELEKNLFLTLNLEITKFRLFLVCYELLFEVINSNKYFGEGSLTIL